ncbi:hypothetical protein LEP1GSC062_3606 [Leptospira alexanderi serovar Manhao 3 str. L 60]|uniref:Uncharacterized protein n=1 Tax=Leptospira alexanderi serovar Manhao 3 str. L 60 TaxID=1049759 RepID=V6I096_9LEPT|nr:hypothetical protein LEP1GSC062_3606 [Leptospira alexanderi serovar Manhao 3 str. L 60]
MLRKDKSDQFDSTSPFRLCSYPKLASFTESLFTLQPKTRYLYISQVYGTKLGISAIAFLFLSHSRK